MNGIKRIFGDTHELVLAGTSALLIAVLLAFAVWTIQVITSGMNDALRVDAVPDQGIQFRIEGARKILETRGLLE